jgi:ribosomal protein S18 acetylase RimI-like enzyme
VTSLVRLAEPDEAETVAGLLVEFRDWYYRDWPPDSAWLAGVERLMEDPDTEFLLGSTDEDAPPTGVAQLRYRYGLWLDAEDCWLEDVFVSEPARGTGLGKALTEGAVERARERGCRRIELDVGRENEAAQRLYRRVGFEDKGAGTCVMQMRLA